MRKSPTRLTATIVGAAYLAAGVAGFFTTGGADGLLIGLFGVNLIHNVAYLLIGAALLIAGLLSVAAAKTVTTIAGTAFLIVGLAGLFIIGTPSNVLALNGADNVLHFASAVLLLAVGLGADRSVTTAVTS